MKGAHDGHGAPRGAGRANPAAGRRLIQLRIDSFEVDHGNGAV